MAKEASEDSIMTGKFRGGAWSGVARNGYKMGGHIEDQKIKTFFFEIE